MLFKKGAIPFCTVHIFITNAELLLLLSKEIVQIFFSVIRMFQS